MMDDYNKAVQTYELTGDKFIDKEFPADETSVGSNLASFVKGWKRPDDNAEVFVDGYSPMDIKQGAIGDCYFLRFLWLLF